MNIVLKSFVKAALLAIACASSAQAARLKDIAAVKGVRENVLIGYGVVVGLKGTGDSGTDVTGQSLARLFPSSAWTFREMAGSSPRTQPQSS